ncbi:YcgN family cysteine cluster protein [Roseitranquillus sediminis]|uniref:YcgN family cysteine cluster protein n=1 Tax=Roseitranquillus sediminis TaxID=2809051 RepID=UPI001D0C4926|nr:YcgN family cysteine cluster protein [Roseitranquillus sediminis]MBM9594950.1 YcgN family cysteine cluster protein [Roseitranquillus sediminis]
MSRPRKRRAPTGRGRLRERFWERVPLREMDPAEWEALCDGCGKCCLNKLEDPDTREIALTRISCRLLDDATCRCAHYEERKQFVPECVVLTPKNIDQIAYWMPATCAYRLLAEGKPLHDWHPLVSGTPDSVHRAGVSVRGWTIPEFEVPEDEWEDHIIEEPT